MSAKLPYTKPHISYEDQIDRLTDRGLVIKDRASALNTLQHINYYRFGVYCYSFESDHTTHRFIPDTQFDDVLNLYNFDRKLRLLVMDAIERIEVSVRAQWTYHLSAAYGAHAHMREEIHGSDWSKTACDLNKEVSRTDEIFIKRILSKYSDGSPPIWAVSEIMSFGLLSKWFKNLRVNAVRKRIAHVYKVHPDILQSWMQHLTVVRNNCAHHSRLWNRHFNRAKPKRPRDHPVIGRDAFVSGHPFFNTLTIIIYLLYVISPGHIWRRRLVALMKEYPVVLPSSMGFPDDWSERTVWR